MQVSKSSPSTRILLVTLLSLIARSLCDHFPFNRIICLLMSRILIHFWSSFALIYWWCVKSNNLVKEVMFPGT